MSEQEQEFFNYITEDIPDVDDQLFQDILDNGIETVDQWEDAYVCSMSKSICVEAQFVEQLMDDLGYLGDGTNESDIPDFLTSHIDWQEVWDCELRHDYFTLESNDQTHFFSRYY